MNPAVADLKFGQSVATSADANAGQWRGLILLADFPKQCAQLSDAAFRVHVEGLSWTMRRRTAGHLDPVPFRHMIETKSWKAAVGELIRAGFWMVTDSGWQILHGIVDQDELAGARRKPASG